MIQSCIRGLKLHLISMSSISTIIDDVAAAARADAGHCDPGAHATLIRRIHQLTLAAETPLETAKRLLYQVSNFYLPRADCADENSNLPPTATDQHRHSCSRRVGIC